MLRSESRSSGEGYTGQDVNASAYYDENLIVKIWDQYIQEKGLKYYYIST